MKPFDLEAAIAGAKLVTRNGQEVKSFTYFKEATSLWPCAAVINGILVTFTLNGMVCENPTNERESDLFIAPEETIYFKNYDFNSIGGSSYQGSYYPTLLEALEANEKVHNKYSHVLKVTTVDCKTTAEIVHHY